MTADPPKNAGEHGASAPRTEALRRLPTLRIVGFAALCVAAVAYVTAGMFAGHRGAPTRTTASGEAAVGGRFTMIDQEGRTVDQRILNGKWSAVFFGYTYCPDVCPTTLQTLAAAAQKLGPRAKDFQVVFVSVDPGRDTPTQLKTYLSNQAFPGGTIGLTGTPEQVGRMAKAYRVYYAKIGTGPDYTLDHSAVIYLMNPRAKFDSVLSESFGAERIAQQIGEAERRG